MKNENMETMDEILEELRSGEFAPLADRIEAAHKREIAEAVAAKCEVCDVQAVTDCNQPVTDCHALDDIVRKVAEEMSNTSMQDITAEIIYGWATRLGDAATCEKSSAVGNAAKMREALEKCIRRLDAITPYLPIEFRKYVFADIQEANIALSAPARNCDRFENYGDALVAFEKQMRSEGRLGFVNLFTEVVKWLFDEAKGDAK